MKQYEENPYPRWTVDPFAALREDYKMHRKTSVDEDPTSEKDVLIAGCGTGWTCVSGCAPPANRTYPCRRHQPRKRRLRETKDA